MNSAEEIEEAHEGDGEDADNVAESHLARKCKATKDCPIGWTCHGYNRRKFCRRRWF